MDWITDPNAWAAFGTLTALEIVLGIDNVVFISILAGRLPVEQRSKAIRVGLGGAMLMRIALLLSIAWVVQLTDPIFSVFGEEISGRDLILLGGGLFLIAKATHEMHNRLEGEEGSVVAKAAVSFASVIFQILLLDVVFSLDSVITAVGMADHLGIMISAVIIAVIVMLAFAGPISAFVERHPTVKILALSFLLLIGVMLIAEGFDLHIPKGYIYFAMAFALFVEVINLRMRRNQKPLKLHSPGAPAGGAGAPTLPGPLGGEGA